MSWTLYEFQNFMPIKNEFMQKLPDIVYEFPQVVDFSTQKQIPRNSLKLSFFDFNILSDTFWEKKTIVKTTSSSGERDYLLSDNLIIKERYPLEFPKNRQGYVTKHDAKSALTTRNL